MDQPAELQEVSATSPPIDQGEDAVFATSLDDN
jgi:hypothetical protein